ncbi:MAG: hypothetical protein KF914_15920 [Rhizobiaceae bacterium]|nr:hypothetical protein [Rhizobiaceae bacterium]
MGALHAFFRDRWRGDIPIRRLFWRDMIVVGSAINAATTLAALAVLVAGYAGWLSLAVFASPTPYNLFLVFAVWRTTERVVVPGSSAYQAGSILWLVLALLL